VKPCCECGRKRERCRPAVRHADGTIDWCCPQCWRALDMGEFFHPPGCRCPHCVRCALLVRGVA
jgi:hypothetical protein